MCTARLQTICVSVATTRCYSGGPQVNKFEQVSSIGDQQEGWGWGSQVWGGWGVPGLKSKEAGPGALYSEVWGIMGNGHRQWQTHMTENVTFPQLR